MNALFVGYKPPSMSSNQFSARLKRRYKQKKAGYSGTLDPFAKGVLICAFGNYTRLFQYLKKAPKSYRATLWLGAHSETLDIEKVTQIDQLNPFKHSDIEDALHTLKGQLHYLPPKYSAKKINGQRAYDLARQGIDLKMKEISSTVYDIKLLHYCHPFVTFEATVSEGTYIRSLGEMIVEKLGLKAGALSALERLNEGKFRYNNEIFLDPTIYLDLPKNRYLAEIQTVLLGQKLRIEDFEIQDSGKYWIDNGESFSIIEIRNNEVKYLLNKVENAHINT